MTRNLHAAEKGLQVRCCRAWGVAMPHYRVYVLNEHGQFMGGVDLACIDDVAAKGHAKRLADGHEVELWRLVARFKFDIPRGRPAAAKRPRTVALRSSLSFPPSIIDCG